MKLYQHLLVGRSILDNNEVPGIEYTKFSRLAYLFGNMAPDLNCIYPAHRLKTTENRFYRKIKLVDRCNISCIKAFELGVLTHYLCDYFCYAHTIESIGVIHKKYETNLYNIYKAHLDERQEQLDDLKGIWKSSKENTIGSVAKNNIIDMNNHCDFIITQLKQLSDYYKLNMHKVNKGWAFDYEQMQMDLTYAKFMVENILGLIVDPCKCLMVTQ